MQESDKSEREENEVSSNLINRLKPEERIDFCIKMRDAALGCEGRRQVYEWKFCILVWTAIGGLIGVLLVNKVPLDREVLETWKLISLGIVILLIVAGFQICCSRATHVDKRRAEMYEDIINDALGITKRDKYKFHKAIKRIKCTHGLWAPFAQIAVTATLLFAFGLIYSAMPVIMEKESENPKPVVTNVAGLIINGSGRQ